MSWCEINHGQSGGNTVIERGKEVQIAWCDNQVPILAEILDFDKNCVFLILGKMGNTYPNLHFQNIFSGTLHRTLGGANRWWRIAH